LTVQLIAFPVLVFGEKHASVPKSLVDGGDAQAASVAA